MIKANSLNKSNKVAARSRFLSSHFVIKPMMSSTNQRGIQHVGGEPENCTKSRFVVNSVWLWHNVSRNNGFPVKLLFFSPLSVRFTTAEFWTRVRHFLKPSPDVAHYILTHFHWLWDVINHTFLRDVLMRLVLTGQRSKLVVLDHYHCH